MSVGTHTARHADELTWCKSSYSGTNGGDCVEVAATTAAVHVRDSKRPLDAALTFSAAQWAAYVAQA
jgi:xanthine/CO dehydrogenase XdhC/CoxF family maturation factor